MNANDVYLYDLLKAAFLSDYPVKGKLFHTREDIPQYEGNYYYHAFNGKTWMEVVDNDFHHIKNVFNKIKTFGFFTTEGFLYYLPAFILYFSRHKDGELMQPFRFRLVPGDTEESMTRQGELFGLLTEVEINAIKKSLEILDCIWKSWGEEDNEAGSALELYWKFV